MLFEHIACIYTYVVRVAYSCSWHAPGFLKSRKINVCLCVSTYESILTLLVTSGMIWALYDHFNELSYGLSYQNWSPPKWSSRTNFGSQNWSPRTDFGCQNWSPLAKNSPPTDTCLDARPDPIWQA